MHFAAVHSARFTFIFNRFHITKSEYDFNSYFNSTISDFLLIMKIRTLKQRRYQLSAVIFYVITWFILV
jgi:hypothetical protein